MRLVGPGEIGSLWAARLRNLSKFSAIAALSAVVFGCATGGPVQTSKEEMEARAAVKPQGPVEQQMARVEVRLDALDERIKGLERGSKRGEQRLNQLSESMGKLSAEIASLGEIATLQAREAKAVPETQPAAPKVELNPVELYRTAYEKFMAGQLDDSIASFRLYVQSFPESDLADNAQYWIGESLFSQNKFEDAAAEFQKVLDLFPEGNKATDAIYKKGLSYAELGKKDLALSEFRILLTRHPNSKAASLAQEAIEKVENTGR